MAAAAAVVAAGSIGRRAGSCRHACLWLGATAAGGSPKPRCRYTLFISDGESGSDSDRSAEEAAAEVCAQPRLRAAGRQRSSPAAADNHDAERRHKHQRTAVGGGGGGSANAEASAASGMPLGRGAAARDRRTTRSRPKWLGAAAASAAETSDTAAAAARVTAHSVAVWGFPTLRARACASRRGDSFGGGHVGCRPCDGRRWQRQGR